MTRREIATPEDLLSVSEAVAKLQKAMFATLERPEPLRRHEKAFRGVSVTADVHLCEAKKQFREAALKGRLRIYTRQDSVSPPNQVSHDALNLIITIRGGLPDLVFSVQRDKRSPCLLALVGKELLVQRRDLTAWLEAERLKLNWPSQRTAQRRKVGRPSLRADWELRVRKAVEKALQEHVGDGPYQSEYRAQARDIWRRLSEAHEAAPSEDTVARILDSIFTETGDPNYRRDQRSRKIP